MRFSTRVGIPIVALSSVCLLSYFSLLTKRTKFVEVTDPNIANSFLNSSGLSNRDDSPGSSQVDMVIPKVPLDKKVAHIRVRSGNLVDYVEFMMADGSLKNGGYIPAGGNQAPSFGLDPVFILDPEENIVRIEVMQGDRLAGLKFYTSRGKESPWFGTKKGRRKVFPASAENPIVAIERDGGGISPRISKVQRLDGSVMEPKDPEPRARAARQPGSEVRPIVLPWL